MNENSRKNGFEFDGRVRYSEIDHRGTMTLPALVNYFQDCTTFHSESVGLGMERLREEKKAWVLSYWQVIVERYPKLNEKITVGTFPTAFKGLFGNRNMYMLMYSRWGETSESRSILRPSRISLTEEGCRMELT